MQLQPDPARPQAKIRFTAQTVIWSGSKEGVAGAVSYGILLPNGHFPARDTFLALSSCKNRPRQTQYDWISRVAFISCPVLPRHSASASAYSEARVAHHSGFSLKTRTDNRRPFADGIFITKQRTTRCFWLACAGVGKRPRDSVSLALGGWGSRKRAFEPAMGVTNGVKLWRAAAREPSWQRSVSDVSCAADHCVFVSSDGLVYHVAIRSTASLARRAHSIARFGWRCHGACSAQGPRVG